MITTPHQTVSPAALSWKFIIRSFPQVNVLLGETSETRETSVEEEAKDQLVPALQRPDVSGWCTSGTQRLHNVSFHSFLSPIMRLLMVF